MTMAWNNDTQEHDIPIPKAPWYVYSTDAFMSGWGPARYTTNRCVVPCKTHDEAMIIAYYVRKIRTDQRRVCVSSSPPRNDGRRPRILSLVQGWVETAYKNVPKHVLERPPSYIEGVV